MTSWAANSTAISGRIAGSASGHAPPGHYVLPFFGGTCSPTSNLEGSNNIASNLSANAEHNPRRGEIESRSRRESAHRLQSPAHIRMLPADGGSGHIPGCEELPHQHGNDREILCGAPKEHSGCGGDQRTGGAPWPKSYGGAPVTIFRSPWRPKEFDRIEAACPCGGIGRRARLKSCSARSGGSIPSTGTTRVEG